LVLKKIKKKNNIKKDKKTDKSNTEKVALICLFFVIFICVFYCINYANNIRKIVNANNEVDGYILFYNHLDNASEMQMKEFGMSFSVLNSFDCFNGWEKCFFDCTERTERFNMLNDSTDKCIEECYVKNNATNFCIRNKIHAFPSWKITDSIRKTYNFSEEDEYFAGVLTMDEFFDLYLEKQNT